MPTRTALWRAFAVLPARPSGCCRRSARQRAACCAASRLPKAQRWRERVLAIEAGSWCTERLKSDEARRLPGAAHIVEIRQYRLISFKFAMIPRATRVTANPAAIFTVFSICISASSPSFTNFIIILKRRKTNAEPKRHVVQRTFALGLSTRQSRRLFQINKSCVQHTGIVV